MGGLGHQALAISSAWPWRPHPKKHHSLTVRWQSLPVASAARTRQDLAVKGLPVAAGFATIAQVRTLTPVQAAVVMAIAGSVLAVALPEFLRNLHASRLVEPIDGLKQIAGRASALAAGRPIDLAYPPTVELTPGKVPRGERVVDPPGTWDHPTWRALAFQKAVPHSFSFAFESDNGSDAAAFRASALGDLDGDGIMSSFDISGQVVEGHSPEIFALEMHREVE